MSETVCATLVLKFRRRRVGASIEAVLANDDLLALILSNLAPTCYVSAGRVCKTWRDVCHRDASIALTVAKAASCLNKRVLMGLLALSSTEADALPRQTCRRRGGGVVYLYPGHAAEGAWLRFVGNAGEWRARLRQRSLRQLSIERSLGPDWRTLQWSRGNHWLDPGRPIGAVH